MYTVSPELIREAGLRLCDAIDGENYFSGTIGFQSEDADCRLVCSVIVYRASAGVLGEEGRAICDLIPVWWEFHTVVDGQERINDFSFSELKEYIL